MKKTLIILLALVLLCFQSPVNAFSGIGIEDTHELQKYVIVGYDEDRKTEIFNSMSDEEINSFIEEYSVEILENRNQNNIEFSKNMNIIKNNNIILDELIIVFENSNRTEENLFMINELIETNSYGNWEPHATHRFRYAITADTSIGYISEWFRSEIDTNRKRTTPEHFIPLYLYRIVRLTTVSDYNLPTRWRVTNTSINEFTGIVSFRFFDLGAIATKDMTFKVGPDGMMIMY